MCPPIGGLRGILTRDLISHTNDDAIVSVGKTKVDAGMESVTEAAWQLAQQDLLAPKLEGYADGRFDDAAAHGARLHHA